ncbi:MAG TPA: hypothetical protein VJ810_03260, partial [Blastocatellia bacterium]|nr:hypothetical protein [Blastocatellia bacterium]
ANCYQLSVAIRVGLDRCAEGLSRNNLAYSLMKLQRYEEARQEVNRALECKRSCGEASQIWTTWTILHNLEQATGNLQAAADARQQAIQSYLAYRRAGGQSLEESAQRCELVFQAIEGEETAVLEQVLLELTDDDVQPPIRTLIPKLQAILRGDRDPALADDQRLNFDDAVELQLLLERLGAN